jgi:uroporphyrinogen III methyltransferase/synthase
MSMTGRVFLIGAGPGDAGLITARGVRLLAEADVVVYDLAVESVLRWTRPEAERIAAGAPAERDTAQDALSMLIAEKARDGHTVARLKWGDPFLFDSGAKEALFLHEQGVPFEVVPGVPAAIGSSAYAGIPLTYPDAGDAVVLLRGHEETTERLPDVNWDAVAHVDGSLACFAGGRLVPAILRELLDHGMAPDTGAALVARGTMAGQTTLAGTVQSLFDRTSADESAEPALLVVGAVARFREHLRWFDERPLFGRRIVVTRSQEQAGDLVDLLEGAGAQPIQAPTFRVLPPEEPELVDKAAASVDLYHWIVFESAGAVTRLLAAIRRGPRDLRALGSVRLCAIGPSAADRLAAAGLVADVVSPEFGGDPIGEIVAASGSLTGRRVLLVRPDHVHSNVRRDLEAGGAAVTDLIAYRSAVAPSDSPAAQELYRQLLEGQIDAVTFTSATAVRRFATLIGEEQAADLLNTTVAAAIGPVTAAAAVALGVRNVVVPDTYTVPGLVDALVRHFNTADTVKV